MHSKFNHLIALTLVYFPKMHLSIEAIVAIVSLVVAAPCTAVLLWQCFRRQEGESHERRKFSQQHTISTLFLIVGLQFVQPHNSRIRCPFDDPQGEHMSSQFRWPSLSKPGFQLPINWRTGLPWAFRKSSYVFKGRIIFMQELVLDSR